MPNLKYAGPDGEMADYAATQPPRMANQIRPIVRTYPALGKAKKMKMADAAPKIKPRKAYQE
jgi:hypothetical protein